MNRWTGTGLTHTGMVRSENQDAFGLDNEAGLWIVADGMGGHAGGKVASQLAVATILDHVRANDSGLNGDDESQGRVKLLTDAIVAGCQAIIRRTTETPKLTGMGTTVVGVLLCPGEQPTAAIAHVGDSRAYLIRDRRLEALTIDHSLVQQLIVEGHITREQARTHPQQNVLLKALGLGYTSSPDAQVLALEPQDMLLLCTDGLTKTIPEDEILAIILESPMAPEEICQRLIDRANVGGGVDNSTVLIVSPWSSSNI